MATEQDQVLKLNPLFEEYSDEDLFYILDCDRLKHVNTYFGVRVSKLLRKRSSLLPYLTKRSKLFESLHSSLTEGPAYITLMTLGIVKTITLSVMGLGVLIAAAVCATLGVASVYFNNAYKKIDKDKLNEIKFYQLNFLKMNCAAELKTRFKMLLAYDGYYLTERPLPQIKKPPHKTWWRTKNVGKLKDAIAVSLVASTTLFTTYYFATAAIIAAFTLTTVSSLMLGPVGIVIALGAALAIGSYFGYRRYRANAELEQGMKRRKHLIEAVEQQKKTCEHLRDLVHDNACRKIPRQAKHFHEAAPTVAPKHEDQHLFFNNRMMDATLPQGEGSASRLDRKS